MTDEPYVNPHLSDLVNECQRAPFLDAYIAGEETICVVADGCLGLELGEAEACAVVPFIVNCIEIALRR